MTGSVETNGSATRSCLVLMFKSPARSKRRIAEELGGPAADVARHLLGCAVEDVRGWTGPACYAPAEAADAAWLRAAGLAGGLEVLQGPGNLGERINRVNDALIRLGQQRQIFIGIDCPQLTPQYLEAADAALDSDDVVLGPAADGGVVLMGARRPWPDLESLPWSEPTLGAALEGACTGAGFKVATLDPLTDVDSLADLSELRESLGSDARPARQALAAWIDRETVRHGIPAP